MPIIEVKNLTKVFGRDPKKAIPLLKEGWTKEKIFKETKMTVGVNQASFSIEAGEIFVIMGLSGSGKSTLVRLLNRLIEPTDGHVFINGKDIVSLNQEDLREVRRKNITMVFQKFALFPHRTVLENVEYGLEVSGIPKAKRQEKAMKSLELVGLKGWENSLPDQLSGGMQQRVGLARGLANDPDVLLMDEAFSALDPLIRKEMQDELLELQTKMKKTIIFITHDLDEALRIGDRIALMKDGNVVQVGTPEEILTNPANKYVERFVEDVDLSKVLTATQVMKRPETITLERGPRVALQFMQERGVSTLYVVDTHKRLLGAITADDAVQAVKEGKKLADILIKEEVPTVSPDTVLNELFDIVSSTRVPVAVVDGGNRLQGIIIRGAVLAALSGNTEGGETV
ncbi:quaternary amine ABC transporter ATP-binding protein [Brevibacillus laterosporus]|uniref:Quaternary amine transport ATP-binding protein n=1 Tax=Brevibacillus laterosporus LMG 15441 TaxID=1042163 RepID=A0A075RA39_BRELA|nr:glycine betaine/L-proline ABC transporter ATP-binding protein [Brevibacillus laterosporus]HAS00823.1 glycine betaine/L-proline ABC transporter ATP-binding protein [Brevibacillus sp.]AIG28128.1 glycine betaine transport ATP-binding protein OpuAA [Brevibacillus laterosporus LMG 15441]AUM66512.1 glycine betaine/L-proline ABC transporter ATP-binding protein [Brevibacillus laterosporus]AYK05387.1 glycine betaine/L-proline ABC transporter ATP-binding protein [Brevibacillus laterosporus]ERM16464.1